YAPRLAEEAYAALTKKYGFTPKEQPLQVEVFPDHAGFAVRTLGLPGIGALGVCFGNVIALDSPRARKPGQFNWGSTLWHEFAHVITRSEEHTSELQSRFDLVCRLLLEKKKSAHARINTVSNTS